MIHDIITEQAKFFADGMQSVMRGHENRTRRVMLLKGNLVQNIRTESRGISARVTKNGYYGFSSAASYTVEDAKKVLKEATENAAFLSSHAAGSRKGYPALASGTIPPYQVIVDFEQKRIIEACRTIDAYIEKTYPDLLSRSITYTEDSQDKIIVTSDAASGHVTYPRCYIYVKMTALATLTGAPVEVTEIFGGWGSFEDNFKEVEPLFPTIDQLYQQLMEKKEGIYAEAGNKLVILGGKMAGMLAHEAVGHTVEADLVMGGSVAGPNLGKPVASELVTLIDYAHTALGKTVPLPVYLDDEGTIAKDAVLIKDGILTGYMNSRESAEYFGMEPCGNARAWDFNDEPLIRMRNTAILPGTNTLEEMIASIDDGYYLVNTSNGQADVTGEFMFGVSMGYEIKKGKLGKAILDTTVSGLAFDMLKTVDMLSDRLYWESSGFCGKKQRMPVGLAGPDMRCRITIGGK
ncbi:MAG: TldD/PmbA family protein [Firmicutes bacterium]|nr:TldD/PmbA family protein [Bacillota bacterium]